MINADRPHLWKQDVAASVDLFNAWFMRFAPQAYRDTRAITTSAVKEALHLLNDMRDLNPAVLKAYPTILPTLRMSTAPPIARDRLSGLAYLPNTVVNGLEKGKVPRGAGVETSLSSICEIISTLLDRDIFPWLAASTTPTDAERFRASTIVADRLCGSQANPLIRNAQEQRQLELIEQFLVRRGYRRQAPAHGTPLTNMEAGTFTFRWNIPIRSEAREKSVNIPIDVVIQPKSGRPGDFPILIEAKSAGDFTNTNKRRKEEATKIRQLQATYGEDVHLTLFLCGYFDSGYLGYEAAEGLDWVWEHRIDDLLQLGI